ncbi:hypothetical protein N752_01135 [Desulforamulus aquiferis]|nr:RcpC/CpaB family pilus assembly protein [Desulforamulus aquiferis]RYD07219.1 hypothetical protein N752_01135 [Desulforamulus aquiferis]
MDVLNSLNGKIIPGDRVDVVASMKLPIGGIQQPVSQTIGICIPVLSVIGEPNKPSGVALALNPQQAQDAAFAEIAGQIKLTVVPYQPDTEASKTTPTTPETFISKYITAKEQSTSEQEKEGND